MRRWQFFAVLKFPWLVGVARVVRVGDEISATAAFVATAAVGWSGGRFASARVLLVEVGQELLREFEAESAATNVHLFGGEVDAVGHDVPFAAKPDKFVHCVVDKVQNFGEEGWANEVLGLEGFGEIVDG